MTTAYGKMVCGGLRLKSPPTQQLSNAEARAWRTERLYTDIRAYSSRVASGAFKDPIMGWNWGKMEARVQVQQQSRFETGEMWPRNVREGLWLVPDP